MPRPPTGLAGRSSCFTEFFFFTFFFTGYSVFSLLPRGFGFPRSRFASFLPVYRHYRLDSRMYLVFFSTSLLFLYRVSARLCFYRVSIRFYRILGLCFDDFRFVLVLRDFRVVFLPLRPEIWVVPFFLWCFSWISRAIKWPTNGVASFSVGLVCRRRQQVRCQN